MGISKHWIIISTRPGWGERVSRALTNKRIENYYPLKKVVRQLSGRNKVVLEPLFAAYIFVYASTEDYVPIRETDGVLSFVYWLGKLASIKYTEVDSIKSFLNSFTDVQLEKIDVNLNGEVKIIHTPPAPADGEVHEVQYEQIKLMLPSIGFSLIAHIPKSHMGKVSVLTTNATINDQLYAKSLSI